MLLKFTEYEDSSKTCDEILRVTLEYIIEAKLNYTDVFIFKVSPKTMDVLKQNEDGYHIQRGYDYLTSIPTISIHGVPVTQSTSLSNNEIEAVLE